LVGGDFQGSNLNIRNSQSTLVTSTALLTADAVQSGDGGKVIVWADGNTNYSGSISATGGSTSGNGGLVEVSGKQNLGFEGTVDTSAVNGMHGSLLLDPNTINISAAAGGADDAEVTADAPNALISILDQNGAILTISKAALEAVTGTLDLSATVAINIDQILNLSATDVSFFAGGTVTVNQNVTSATNAANMTFQGNTAVDINADISVNNATLTLDGGAVTLDGAASTNGGDFVSQGTSFTSGAGGTIATTGGAVNMSLHTGVVTIGGTMTSTGGNIQVGAPASSSVNVNAAINAGAGEFTATGVALNTTAPITATNLINLNIIGATVIGDTLTLSGGGTIQTSGSNFTSTGQTIALGAGGALQFAGQTGVIGLGAVTGSGASSISIASGTPTTMTYGGNVIFSGAGTINTTSSGATTVTGALSTTNGSVTLAGSSVTGGGSIATGGATASLTSTGGAVSGVTLNTGTGAATLNATGGVVNISNISVDSHQVNLTGSGDVTYNANSAGGGDTLTVNISTAGGNLVVDTTGAMTVAGKMTVTGTVQLDANDQLQVNAAIDPTTVALNSEDNISIAAAVAASSTITATAGTDGTGTVTVTSAGSVAAGGLATLDGIDGVTVDNSGTVSGVGVALNAASGIVTVGNSTIDGTTGGVTIVGTSLATNANDATTDISGTGILSITGGAMAADFDGFSTVTVIQNAAGTVSLDEIGNGPVTTTNLTANAGSNVNISYNGGGEVIAVNSLAFQGTTVLDADHNFNFTSTGGAITQAAGITLAGTNSFAVGGANNLTLNNVANNLGTFGVSSGNDVDLRDAGALELGASTITGTLNVLAAGALTQAVAAPVTVSGLTTTLNAGANVITLTNTSNQFSQLLLTGGTTQITETGAIDLGASTIGGVLTVIGDNTISTLGLVTTGANAASFTTTGAAANGNVTLANASVFGDVTIVSAAGSAVSLNENGTVVIAGITSGGTLAVTSTGSITQSGAVVVDGATADFTAMGAVNLAGVANNIEGIITVTAGGGQNVNINNSNAMQTVLGTISEDTLDVLSTNVPITQSGATTLTLTGASTFSAVGAAITLTQANDFQGTVALTNTGANNVAITDANALDFTTSSVGSGTFIATGVGITQTGGAITQAASAGAATFNGGAGVITLTQGANDFTGAVSLNNSGALAVALTDTNAVILGTSVVGSGTLDVTAGGAITQTGGAITQAGGTSTATFIAGGDIILDQSNEFLGAVDLANAGGAFNTQVVDATALSIAPSSVGSGTLTLTAGGAITQTGAILQAGVDGSGGAVSLNAGANSITLTQANDFTGVVSLANVNGVNLSVTDIDQLDIGATTVTGTLATIAVTTNITTGAVQAAQVNIDGASDADTLNVSQNITATPAPGTLEIGTTANGIETINISGGATLAGASGLTFANGSVITLTGAGAVTLNGGAGVIAGGTSSLDASTTPTPLLLLSNGGFTGFSSGLTGTGTLTLAPITPGTNIDIEFLAGSGYYVNNMALAGISDSFTEVVIGSTAAGAVTIGTDNAIDLSALDGNGKDWNLTVIGGVGATGGSLANDLTMKAGQDLSLNIIGGTFTQGAGAAILGGQGLALSGGATFNLTEVTNQ
ncbi:MAG: S-layer family protein, partial [Phycisphaeraceae bacterium]|nr:S-layer family protein [Phycisphaeraceae bacterium]